MFNLLHNLNTYIKSGKRWRFRDWRAHYPSQALSCRRDQYWSLIGEERTNQPDYLSKQRMFIGNALEDGLINHYIKNLGTLNVHLLGTQVPVGRSNPNWNGYLDALVGVLEDGKLTKYCVEIKTKTGFGADMMFRSMEPQDSHLAQIGLYLKDLQEKGITNEGVLLYYLLSNNNIGNFVSVHCRYDADTDTVEAYYAENNFGNGKQISATQSIKAVEERWLEVEKAVEEKKCPAGDFKYKHAYTPEFLRDISDAQIEKIFSNKAVIGDWQVQYSDYKDKQLELDGVALGNTMEERRAAFAEYKRRHPKGRKTIKD